MPTQDSLSTSSPEWSNNNGWPKPHRKQLGNGTKTGARPKAKPWRDRWRRSIQNTEADSDSEDTAAGDVDANADADAEGSRLMTSCVREKPPTLETWPEGKK
ncbi:GM12491 [Drosophila sechellia]|uniref:GM12491 n=1 Tax=Drosophila sechellia TaxID=7238 RepID=B4I0A4_DROSE|nr:GM12491 [Drosophila sechellia]